ncbi:discoidin domain-containing protein [Bifidobacterium sp. ESL0704]|uniref:galactose-binding domain-containing protein n=1 Tax=Bifidobacterium sp. ESL0704 TaxID=2983219 RepID=UPI0023F7DDCE|nr:discoidin domain-containing protein [Bifidobacterium sp. ESL0704]WEV53191.1 discoidin domain-containing protein [Bifidobacterium sp. ESL0704]
MQVHLRKYLGVTLGALVAVATLFTGGICPASASERIANPNSAIGYPTFKGDKNPIPENGVAYDPATSYLGKVFDKDVANGAGSDTEDKHDFWIDKMLTRKGDDPKPVDGAKPVQGPYGEESVVSQGKDGAGNTYSYNDPDGNVYLFSRGRAAYMYTHDPAVLGFGGNLAYWDITDNEGYDITVSVAGNKQNLTEDAGLRKQTPSYWKSVFFNADKSLKVIEVKYITNNNVLVTDLHLSSDKQQDVTLSASSPLAAVAEGNELTGRFAAKNNVTTVYPRFSGNGFTPNNGSLVSSMTVPASGEVTAKLQLGLVTREIPESRSEYDAIYRGDLKDPSVSYKRHVTDYNRWWVDNIPYIQTPEQNIDKTVFYRWWLSRFNYLDANMPGGVLQFPTSIEGVLGYNNAIDLTIGMFMDDLKWMRNPEYSYGPWLSAGETAGQYGQFRDNPAAPDNWGASHTQWISEAAWDSYMIHGGPKNVAELLAGYAANDAKGQLKVPGRDVDNDMVLDTNWNAWTGNDADAVSFDEYPGYALDRAESATIWAGAVASAKAYRAAGDDVNAQKMEDYAAKMKKSYISSLWDGKDKLIRHKWVTGPGKGQLAKYKEINNYTPYSVGLMPAEGDSDYKDDYENALRLLADADEHPIFPFATANQADDKEVRKLGKNPTNNFSIINSDLYFRTYQAAIRKYHAADADRQYVTPEMYKKLLYWNAFAHYQGGDNRYADQNEFWNVADPKDGGKVQYRSWIHHTQLGSTNWTMIEDVAGMTSRADNKIELNPIALPGWKHFTVNNLNYHGRDVSVVWNADGTYQAPVGYTVYIGGKAAFTVDKLAHVIYDPATGEVQIKDDSGASVLASATADMPAATGVKYGTNNRVTDLFAKAGTNVNADAVSQTNLALNKDVQATFEANDSDRAAKNAVDGSTVNQNFWSTKGTPNAKDSLTVDFGTSEKVDDIRLYFYQTSTSATISGYAEPSMYGLEYFDGAQWKPIPSQARTPNAPDANFNEVRFPAITAQKIRVTVTPQSDMSVGLKEIEAYDTGFTAPASTNTAPVVDAFVKDQRTGLVTLGGSVKDDGMPSGTLQTTWMVKSAPKGGEVKFTDSSSVVTNARFSKKGEYVLTLTASDGSLQSSADVSVQGTVSDGTVNVAPDAKASASYTSQYYRLSAINDRHIVYNVNQEDSTHAWGNWRQDNPSSEWLQYDWSKPMRLTRASIAFWWDNGNQLPQSWKLQYKDSDNEWTDVQLKDGSSYTTKRNRMNDVQFAKAITTTQLRAVFQATPDGNNYYSFGVGEFEAYAEDPLSVDRTAISTLTGEVPELPKTVNVAYGDGTRADLPVTWPAIKASQLTDGSQLSVEGSVVGSTLPAELTIYANNRLGDTPTNMESEIPEQFVYRDSDVSKLQLPKTVIVGYNNGQRRNLAVTWNSNEIAKLDFSKLGTTQVHGTVKGAESLNPVVKITVIEKKNDDQQPVTADKAALKAKIDEIDAENNEESQYTPETWKAFADALSSAKEVYDDSSASQQEVDSALQSLIDAHAALRKAVNRSVLKQDVDEASSVNHSLYREDTRDVLDGALAQGQRMLADKDAKQADVDAAAKAIDQAMNGLVKLDKPAPNIAGNATAKASYTTAWNRLASINDGKVFFTSTGDSTADNSSTWGTWSASNPKQQWLEYDWVKPVTVDHATMYFWYDNAADNTADNVPMPIGWHLQYLNDKNEWKDVASASSLARKAIARDKGSTISFAPVTTAKLRAVIDANTDGSRYAAVAASEFEVYAVRTVVDKSSLDKAIADAGSLHEQDYASGWQQLQQAVADGKALQSDDEATQDAVDAAAKAIRTAIAALVKKPVAVTGIVISADGIIDGRLPLQQGNSIKLKATVSPNNATDCGVVWSSANSQIATVGAEGTVTAVAPGVVGITAASHSNPSVKQTISVVVSAKAPVAPPVDRSALRAKLEQIESEHLQQSQYTPQSWKRFAQKLAAAKSVLADSGATQAQIDSALQDLSQARSALTDRNDGQPNRPANKSELQQAVANAGSLRQQDYTPESWSSFAKALGRAQALLADPSAGQGDVDAALVALRSAQGGLRMVPSNAGHQHAKRIGLSSTGSDIGIIGLLACVLIVVAAGIMLRRRQR